MLFFCFLVLAPALAAVVPRHAAGAAPAALNWTTCAGGYYRTASQRAPTCRACGSQPPACALGWRSVPCSALADAHCARCDPPPLGHSYATAGDCDRTVCSDGWWSIQASDACAPCPIGMVCAQGAPAVACPGNCSTAAAGTSTLLQCVSDTDAAVLRLQWDVFWIATSADPAPPACAPAMDGLFLAWVLYGAYERCVLTAQSAFAATLACTLMAPSCILDAYTEWALATVPVDAVRGVLADCATPGAAVVLGPLSSSLLLLLPAASKNPKNIHNNTGGDTRYRYYDYSVEHRRWGQSHMEQLDTLGLCAAILLGMLFGVSMACALACTRLHRRRLMRRAFWKQRIAAVRRIVVGPRR